MAMDIVRAIRKHIFDADFDYQFGLEKQRQISWVTPELSGAMQANPVRGFKFDKVQTDFLISMDITHRKGHAVATKIRESQRLFICTLR